MSGVGSYSHLVRGVSGAILLSELVCVSILNRSFNLRLVCCFLRFKKLKELSTTIFDSPINISVVFLFQPTWAILEIKGCTLAKYQRSRHSLFIYHW